MTPAPTPTNQVIDSRSLRITIHAELDKLSDHSLERARKLILELQLHEVVDELDQQMDEARECGHLTQESIAATIQAHRRRFPYKS